jgi:hypothetical protein
VLTRLLLTTPGGCFYETNPVARFILNASGWWGLALFKIGCAGTVLGVSAWLARRRPQAARGVLAVACPVMGLVVGYSLWLASGPERRTLLGIAEERQMLEQKARDREEYRRKLHQLARAVLGQTQALPDAVRELKVCLASLTYDLLDYLRSYYPGLEGDALAAVALMREAGHFLEETGQSPGPALRRLEAEFASAYACPLPSSREMPCMPVTADEIPRPFPGFHGCAGHDPVYAQRDFE